MMRSPVGIAVAARVIKAGMGLMRRMQTYPRRHIRVSRVSEEWLRAFAREASKHQHRDDS